MECLIIVDIQRDFMPGGSLAVKGGDEIIGLINHLQVKFPLVIATQDWHPSGHMSFASSHEDVQPLDVIKFNNIEQVLWPDHCVQGTRGAEFSDNLDGKQIEAIFRKGTDPAIDSYSGFFDNGRLKNTGLEGYLKAKGVTSVSVCGLTADFCVYYTAIDALSSGFKANIIENATRAIDHDGYREKRERFLNLGGRIA